MLGDVGVPDLLDGRELEEERKKTKCELHLSLL